MARFCINLICICAYYQICIFYLWPPQDRMLKRAIEYDRNNEFEDARELYSKALAVYAKAKQRE